MIDLECEDEELDSLIVQMKDMPFRLKRDVLIAAQKLLKRETEISLDVLSQCRKELDVSIYRQDEEVPTTFTDPYADSSPENSPTHSTKYKDGTDSQRDSSSANAFQARAIQNRPSYARPISANRLPTASGSRNKTMRMTGPQNERPETSGIRERSAPSAEDDRLANLKQSENPEELDEQKSQLMNNMAKQDTKLEHERERQRSALRARMQQQKEKIMEQQAGQAIEMLGGAMATEQSQMQNKEKQGEQIKKRLKSMKKQRGDGDDESAASPPLSAGSSKSKSNKKQSVSEEADDAPPEEPAAKPKQKKSKPKADDHDLPPVEGDDIIEKPKKKKRSRAGTTESTVVEIESANDGSF